MRTQGVGHDNTRNWGMETQGVGHENSKYGLRWKCDSEMSREGRVS